MTNRRLEDFGVRETMSAQQRKKEYIAQCKSLPSEKRAKFLLEIKKSDPEVFRLFAWKVVR